MRELQLWDPDEALETTFDDIDALAQQCRFRDCQHRAEPGCAVQKAVADGRLAAHRVESFHKLSAEQEALADRRVQLERLAERRRTKTGARAMRSTRKLSDG